MISVELLAAVAVFMYIVGSFTGFLLGKMSVYEDDNWNMNGSQ